MKKVIILVIVIIGGLFIAMFCKVNSNNRYNNNIYDLIYNNTNIENIIYYNKSNNYYIVKTNDKLYVIDYDYNIIKEEDIVNIKDSKLDIVYKNNRLLYEKVNDNEYIYYDIYSLDKVEILNIGG